MDLLDTDSESKRFQLDRGTLTKVSQSSVRPYLAHPKSCMRVCNDDDVCCQSEEIINTNFNFFDNAGTIVSGTALAQPLFTWFIQQKWLLATQKRLSLA